MFRNLPWKSIRLAFILLAVIALNSFTRIRNSARKVTQISIHIDHPDQPLMTSETVNKLLIEKIGPLQSQLKDGLDLNTLEISVRNLKMVQQAQVALGLNGKLSINIKQRVPVGRVFLGTRSFYIDTEGINVPLSDFYTAHVPLITGKVGGISRQKLTEVLQYIQADSFLKKNIIGLKVLDQSVLEMYPRNQDFVIDFGRPIRIREKFKNYQAFFQKAVVDSSLGKYKRLNLRYTQQVVCIK
ncbi:MAG: cell division protein FtsQ [Flavobacterium sp. BFFFF2]|nr:MAG: cell division protein FtsQ [Flavobacterium sp. BFFFF2]